MGPDARLAKIPRSESRDVHRRSPLHSIYRMPPSSNESHMDSHLNFAPETRLESRDSMGSRDYRIENHDARTDAGEMNGEARRDSRSVKNERDVRLESRGDDSKEVKHDREAHLEPKNDVKIGKDGFGPAIIQVNWKEPKEYHMGKRYLESAGGHVDPWHISRGNSQGPVEIGKEVVSIEERDYGKAHEAVGENKAESKGEDKFKDKDRKRKDLKHREWGDKDKERSDRRGSMQVGNSSAEGKESVKEEREGERWEWERNWTLFMEKLGHGIALSPEVERIAVDIVRECAGLPLGIITMAGSLRGVDDEHEWRHTLEKFKESNFGDMEDEVSRVLRFSYDRLDDFALQQSLLYCALFPEGHEIEREELIDYLIDGGIIVKMGSWGAAFDKGHVMLDKLENAGLLERIDGGRAVKMHDLVRDMAVHMRKENPDVKEQRRKGIEMVGSNIGRFWNHVEQTNDGILKCKFCGNRFAKGTSLSRIKWHLFGERGHGVAICGRVPKAVQKAAFLSMHGGNSTHKTMVQRRKRIEMAPLKSGWTGAISAYAQEKNNVDMAQQREPLLTGEFERANDLTGAGIELPPDTPDDQDELKLKGSKSRDMVDDFKSGWTLLMTNLFLEIASAVFDQLGYALVGMVLAFVALLLAAAELIHMARRERMSLLPSFHRPSTSTLAPGKTAGTIVEYFGLVGGV